MNTYDIVKPFCQGVTQTTTICLRLPAGEQPQPRTTLPLRDLGILALTALTAGAFDEDPEILCMFRKALNDNTEVVEDWLNERLLTEGEEDVKHQTGGCAPRLVGEEAQTYYGEEDDWKADAIS